MKVKIKLRWKENGKVWKKLEKCENCEIKIKIKIIKIIKENEKEKVKEINLN